MRHTFIYISRPALAIVLMVGLFGYIITPEKAEAAITKRVYLISGTTWTVPSDWNSSSNTIETIGGGGHGGQYDLGGGGGGGGGAYASISNLSLTPGASVTYRAMATSDTVFNSSATTCGGSPTPSVCAMAGVTASLGTGGAGGTAAVSVGTTKYDGGAGASSMGGGGGAAGPSGAGAAGDNSTGGNGGNGVGGSGGNAGFSYCGDLDSDGGAGEDGYPGYEYDTIPGHGSGGGGGPGGTPNGTGFTGGQGGAGGTYGGGGGGGGSRCGLQNFGGGAGNGAGGLIIITYSSTESPGTSTAKFKILGGKVQIIGGRIIIR